MRRKFVLRCLSCALAGMLLLDAPLQVFAENESGSGETTSSVQSENNTGEEQNEQKPQEGERQTADPGESKDADPQEKLALDDGSNLPSSTAPLGDTGDPVEKPSDPLPSAPAQPQPSNDLEGPANGSSELPKDETKSSGLLDNPEPEEPKAAEPEENTKPTDNANDTELKGSFVLSGMQYGSVLDAEPEKASEELLTAYKDALEVLQSALQEKAAEADLSEQKVNAEVLQDLLSYIVNDSDTDCSLLLPEITYYYIEETDAGSRTQTVQNVLFSYLSEADKLVLKQESRTLETGVELSFHPDGNAEGYRLYRCSSENGEWELANELSKDTDGSYTDPVTGDSEYTYLLVAVRTDGDKEGVCNFSDTLKSTYTFATPENLKAEGTDTAVTLSWDPVTDATAYEVEVSGETEEDFTLLETVTEPSFVHEGLESGTSFRYRVRAVRRQTSTMYRVRAARQAVQSAEVYSAYSEPVTGTTMAAATPVVPEKAASEETITIPAVELSAVAAAYNQIRLDWKDAGAGVSYEIYRNEAGGSRQLVQTIAAGGLSWVDTAVSPGIAYTYQVRGVKSQQGKSYEGAYSKEATVTTELDAVSGFVVGTSDMQSLNISWGQVSGADGYELYRSASPGSGYSLLATLPAQTLAYQDQGLSLGSTYYYQVRAYVSANGKKVYGAYAPETGGTVKLSEVQNLTVTQLKATALRISWTGASDAQSYEVYYSTSPDSGYKRLKTEKKTFYDFKKAKCGVTYYFKVRTYRKDGKVKTYGDDSAVISGRTVLTGSPTVTVKKVTCTSIALKWTKVKDAKKYEIWYSTAPDGNYQLLKTQGGTSFTHKKLITGQTYYYKVYPLRDSFKGDASNVVSAKSTLTDLSGLKVARSGNNGMKLSWKKVTGASNYVILRSTSADGTYTEVARTNKTKYTDTGLAANTTYYYKVYATSGVVDSKPAGPIGQSTPAPATPSEPSSGSSSDTSTKPLYYGVDVSSYQGKIDWEDAADDGIDFAMIRILTGKGTSDLSLDSRFEYNYREARAAGVKVGVYRYSYATTRGGARREARRIVEVLDGRKLEYPIVLDMEDESVLNATSREDRTEIILGFKDIVESAGYKFALYANKNWIDNYIDPAALKGVDIWFARWRSLDRGPGYSGPGNLAMWQYSDQGSVDGIPGRVDLDVSYKRY